MVESLPVEWAALGGAVLFVLAIVAHAARTARSLTEAEQRSKASMEVAKGAVDRVSTVERELADHKERVARDYVSHEAMRAIEARLVEAISRLGDRMDAIIDKILTKER